MPLWKAHASSKLVPSWFQDAIKSWDYNRIQGGAGFCADSIVSSFAPKGKHQPQKLPALMQHLPQAYQLRIVSSGKRPTAYPMRFVQMPSAQIAHPNRFLQTSHFIVVYQRRDTLCRSISKICFHTPAGAASSPVQSARLS